MDTQQDFYHHLFLQRFGLLEIIHKKIIKSFFIFCLIYFLGGLEMSLIIISLNRLIDNYNIAWLIGAFIGALNNYLGSKYFLFKK